MFKPESIDQRIRRNAPFPYRAFWKYGSRALSVAGAAAVKGLKTLFSDYFEDTASWDFDSSNYELDTSVYLSAPSSIRTKITNPYSSVIGLVKTSVLPIADVAEGRIIAYFNANGGTHAGVNHLKFFFRYQDASNHYLVDIHQVSAPGGNIDVIRVKDGSSTTLGTATDPNWPSYGWSWDGVRITWLGLPPDSLAITVEKYVAGAWTLVMVNGGIVYDPSNYWSTGGRVGFYTDCYLEIPNNLDNIVISGMTY